MAAWTQSLGETTYPYQSPAIGGDGFSNKARTMCSLSMSLVTEGPAAAGNQETHMNANTRSSPPQVPGPQGWAQHDYEARLAQAENVAANTRLAMKLIGAVAVVLLLGLSWMFRWEITPVDGRSAYMQDRWSGVIYYLHSEEKFPLVTGK